MERTVLIVEDEPSIVTLLQYNLKQHHFKIDVASNGLEAIQKVNQKSYDLIILDVMLPEIDGIQVCKYIRNEQALTPILMITALNQEEDMIKGLNSGADDYMTKPFSPRELVARIQALLRRAKAQQANQSEEESVMVGELKAFPEKFEVYLREEQLKLTRKEYELLIYLMRHKELVLSREQLLNEVWDYEVAGDTRIVDVHIARLRQKIEEDNTQPKYIQTVHGFGYKITSPI